MKAVAGYMLIYLASSPLLLAEQGYYDSLQPVSGPDQINWPRPVDQGYANPGYSPYSGTVVPDYAPPSGNYYPEPYSPYPAQSGYWTNRYPQIEYVAPPGWDWPAADYPDRSLIPPDMLLRDGFVVPDGMQPEYVPMPYGQERGTYPTGRAVQQGNRGYKAGTPIEVVPPPNIPLSEEMSLGLKPDIQTEFIDRKHNTLKDKDAAQSKGSDESVEVIPPPNIPLSDDVPVTQEPDIATEFIDREAVAKSAQEEEAAISKEKSVEVVPPPNIKLSEEEVLSDSKPESEWRPSKTEQEQQPAQAEDKQ